ncbi:MAG TPA: metabolite traffic protein EboE [Methylomirabilota bacterium]|jgi:sugar phosphate isomerase/epimerase|nr:metabolite traffic protein EboE [Methylomirabilota bacterium]
MKLSAPGQPHLTYCTNIHAGETWAEVRANLERYVVAVKSRVAPDRRFGVGLRLSAQAADALAEPRELEAFRGFLASHGLYVFTINGFPYGPFHGTRVKEDVYLPDWLDPARLAYTDRLATLLAELLPDEPGLDGSVSTVPGAFKARVAGEADAARMAEMMLRHLATLHRIRERTGKIVSLALEPEPCCHLETIAETVAFFQRHLFTRGAAEYLGGLTGLDAAGSEAFIRRHLGVCFDACHMAVEFEDAAGALDALRAAGIRIGKVQISAGLEVRLGSDDAEGLRALRPFAEGVYLHQVVERSGAGFTRYVDLPEALAVAERSRDQAREWRIHFHVPLFREQLGRFVNTQAYLRTLLAILHREPVSTHLEVETYTWDVLPEEYRREDIVVAVARELTWVLSELK